MIEKFLQVSPALPLLSSKAVSTKISRLYSKSIKFKSNKVTAKVSSSFKDSPYKLFDIISCQCEIINCGGDKACRDVENCTGFHVFCTCPTEKKIPEKEVMFIKDQREKVGLHGGDMIMEGVDKRESDKLRKLAQKEFRKAERVKKRGRDLAILEEKIKRRKKDKCETSEKVSVNIM